MTFERNEYEVEIGPAFGPVIYPTLVTCVYRLNTVPTARVDLAFGEGFEQGDTEELEASLERVAQWAEERTLVQIRYRRTVTNFDTGNAETQNEVIFEGYFFAPTFQLASQGASYTFQMQHWSRDLSLGSLLVDYALPGHPQSAAAQLLYRTQTLGDAGLIGGHSAGNLRVEGLAWKLGLEADWYEKIVEDIWAYGQKEILAALLLKQFNAPVSKVLDDCANSINGPSQLAQNALQRIQGPSTALGRAYTEGVPLKITDTISDSAREILGTQIGDAIGNRSLSSMQRTNAWQQLLSFLKEFGCNFVARPTDAVIVPFNAGIAQPYTVEVVEDEDFEVSWTSFKQIDVRGVGVLTGYSPKLGEASLIKQLDADLLAHGCFLGSQDPDDGMVIYTRPPVWMRDLPPVRLNTEMARKAARGSGMQVQATGLPEGVQFFQEPQESTSTEDQTAEFRKNTTKNLYDAYAHMLYLESNLQGQSAKLATYFRTDIAPGSAIRIRLRSPRLTARLGFEVSTLVAIVTSATLAIHRGRHAVTSYDLNYTRSESQLSDDRYTLDEHAYFANQISGLPLVPR